MSNPLIMQNNSQLVSGQVSGQVSSQDIAPQPLIPQQVVPQVNVDNVPKLQDGDGSITNIWRVDRESHIDKILLNTRNKIVMVTFSYGDPRLKIFLKRQLAANFPDCCFVLALVDNSSEKKYNFNADRGSYIKLLKGKQLPFVFFYYNTKCIAHIAAAESAVIVKALLELRITLTNTQNQQTNADQPNQPNQEINPTNSAPVTAQTNNPQQFTPNIQNQIQQNRLAHEYQIEKMLQQKKLHDLEELEKIQKIKETQEKQDKLEQKQNRDDSSDSPEKKISKSNKKN